MNKFFNYTNPICIEGHTPIVFSYDPSILSLKELLIYELQQIAYYITKLEDLEIDTSDDRNRLVKFISLVVVNLDFRREMFDVIIQDLKAEKLKLETEYIRKSEEMGLPVQTIKSNNTFKTDKFDIISAINQGEKHSLLKNLNLSKNKKNLYEIMINLAKNSCLYLVEIENYDNAPFVEGEKAVVRLLTAANFMTVAEDKLKNKVNEFIKINIKIMTKLKEILLNKYGPIVNSEVELSLKAGKAILVSGHFFKDLELVLEATKDSEINVYTHGDMLVAHSFKYFKKYKNLVGHYQRSLNNLQLDFASFPGVVLVTKNSQPHLDIIRGRIFTFEKHPAYGMAGIKEENLSELIKAANDAKGFRKDIEINKINVGFNTKEIDDKMNDIISKIKIGKIKHLFIIGLLNSLNATSLYIEKFLSLIPDDAFAISLSYTKEKENIWHIDSYSGIFLFHSILEKLKQEFSLPDLNLTVFLTRCDEDTISHIATLKNEGVKDIFVGNCCPTLISPALIEGLKDIYGIHYMSNSPQEDLEKILKSQQ